MTLAGNYASAARSSEYFSFIGRGNECVEGGFTRLLRKIHFTYEVEMPVVYATLVQYCSIWIGWRGVDDGTAWEDALGLGEIRD